MEILDFINGSGAMLLLAAIVVIALGYQQYKKWRYFKSDKKKKK